jgi:cyclopropane fatty-acyl-phospholipid synthase-like methyltransferase
MRGYRMVKWHDDDNFWVKMAPMLFPPERMDAAASEVDAILNLTRIQSGSVLDMGCGVGRHSLELARRGFTVTGVDRTHVYLKNAEEQASAEKLDIEFIQADMRNFQRIKEYDAVVSMFTTFGYFETQAENEQVLININNALKSPGVLIMEMMGKEVLARIFRERGWQQIGKYYFLEERSISRDWSWVENRWILIGEDEHYEVEISHWVYSAAELQAMLMASGFKDVQFYGDLAGSPYDTTANRLVAVAQK